MKNKLTILIFLSVIPLTFFSLQGSQLAASQTYLLGPSYEQPPEVCGTAFALYDVEKDTFLLGKNLDSPLSPASTTKVMTALLALENLKMQDKITITQEMFQTIPNDYMRLGLMEGEIITVEDAIYSCMLLSANDSAMALALTLSNSIEEFNILMNEKAKELGCLNTNFTNPYGYADLDHLCSAHDMALILAEALNNSEFQKIALTKHYSMNTTNLFETPRGMANGNGLLTKPQFTYEYFVGGKTGYTDLSGNTLVAGARKDGRTLIAVIFGAKISETRYTDAISLFEYGFSQYEAIRLADKDFDNISSEVLSQIEMIFSADNNTIEISDKIIDYTKEILVPNGLNVSDLNFFTQTIEIDSNPMLEYQTLEYPFFYKVFDGIPKKIGSIKCNIKISPAKTALSSKRSGEALFIFLAITMILISVLSYFIIFKTRRKKKRKIRVYRRI